jgi:hypothetical protein
MKKLVVLLALAALLLPSAAFAAVEPEIIDGMVQNDFILDEMLPNPNVYLYGTDSNGYPILLMNFSSTIPFYAIEDNYRILPQIGRYWSIFRKKVSHLQFFSLYLKIEPTCICGDKGFTYKIIKLQCDEKSQNIKHQDINEYTIQAKPQYQGADVGSAQGKWTRQQSYDEERPIIAYSGVGSDTLKIMLKKGKKYRIPSGHIDVAIAVIAVPNYVNAPNSTYVDDFITANCKCGKKIRSLYFGKTYMDNRIKNYYEVSPSHNPRGVNISSEVIEGSRIKGIPVVSTTTIENKTSAGNVSSVIKGKILDDNMIMYDNIFNKQIPNTYSLYSTKDNVTNFNIK